MRFREFAEYAEDDALLEQKGGLKLISKQQAVNKRLFGPVYHGTTEENWALIKQEGFKTIVGIASSGGVRNGYDLAKYAFGLPPPVHHLGYGVYFTTSKSIAKRFNEGSLRGLMEFYLNVPRLGTINFGAPNTMMKWWMSYGYDMPPVVWRKDWIHMHHDMVEDLRYKATMKMTKQIRKEYDAVWYKGGGMYQKLDGDQVCVYDPRRIYAIDPKLSKGLEIGAKVTHNQRILPTHYNIRGEMRTYIPPPNVRGVIIDKRPIPPAYWESWAKRAAENGFTLSVPKDMKKARNWFAVRWSKGGTDFNYTNLELVPVVQGGKSNAR